MTTTHEKLKESIESILLSAWGDIVAHIESIDEKALALLNDEQRMRLMEMIIEAAGRCANFASSYYCDAGDVLTVKGNVAKITITPGKGVAVQVYVLNTTDNIIALAEMGSGVSIHGLQTVIPNTVAPKVAGEAGGQMGLGEVLTEGEASEGEETQGDEADDGVQRGKPDWWENDEAPAVEKPASRRGSKKGAA